MIREIVPIEFDESLLPVLQAAFERFLRRREFKFPGWFYPAHFLPAWRRLMEQGVARTLAGENAILGGLIVPDLFTGDKNGIVVFWGKLPGGEAEGLLPAFENIALEADCRGVYVAALDNTNRTHMRTKYRARGYKRAEEIFVKFL